MPAPGAQGDQGDGRVEAYHRVVNGKVVKVNAYAKRSTTTTRAAQAVRRVPGRPRIAAQPGSYTSGRDIPGAKAVILPPPKKSREGPVT